MHFRDKIAIVIPARYNSSRFPGKPLVKIGGRSMIERVYKQCGKASNISEIWVATDNSLIYEEVEKFGGSVMLTSPLHHSGTDRIVEASENIDADIIINVQGDEPMIPPEMINQAADSLVYNSDVLVGTLRSSFSSLNEVSDPNYVKVVVDADDFALYFSRSPIPYIRDAVESSTIESLKYFNKHVGIYAYRKEFLRRFPYLSASPLEKAEKLEQLRILQNGYKIKIPHTPYFSPSVDVPSDLEKIKNL